ncbi:MAG: VWA domain-containing protein [Cyanobacteria bacterium REEB67]|nr:VWA domain-containing protein [Cyanobacteria bacterium REEB67]
MQIMQHMHFINQQVLWLLAFVPVLAGLGYLLARHRTEKILDEYGERPLIQPFIQPITKGRLALRLLFLSIAAAALIVALSRPVREHGNAEFPTGTIDVMAVVDVSRSMAIPDYRGQLPKPYDQGRRLDMAKYLLIHDVMGSLSYNQLGMVTFSGKAWPQAFLTHDMEALRWVTNRAVYVGSAPGEGSELAMAFDMAFQLFDLDSKPEHRRVIVLFSDGGNDSSYDDMAVIIRELKKRNIELIIAGLGKLTPSAVPVALLSPQDQALYHDKQYYENDGEVVTSRLDENSLLLLKNAVGGRYTRVEKASDFTMTRMVSRLETVRKPGTLELFPYALLTAFLSLVLAMLIAAEARFARPNPKKGGSHADRK